MLSLTWRFIFIESEQSETTVSMEQVPLTSAYVHHTEPKLQRVISTRTAQDALPSEDEVAWTTAWTSFSAFYSIPLPESWKVDNLPINPFSLYQAITSRGGLSSVREARRMGEVCNAIGFGITKAQQFLNIYQKCMLLFEHFDLLGELPQCNTDSNKVELTDAKEETSCVDEATCTTDSNKVELTDVKEETSFVDEATWTAEWKSFSTNNLIYIPKGWFVHGKRMNPFSLYQAITSRGGLRFVRAAKKMGEVCSDMEVPRKFSQHLIKIYTRFMLAFEHWKLAGKLPRCKVGSTGVESTRASKRPKLAEDPNDFTLVEAVSSLLSLQEYRAPL